jgi:hypothetical protein
VDKRYKSCSLFKRRRQLIWFLQASFFFILHAKADKNGHKIFVSSQCILLLLTGISNSTTFDKLHDENEEPALN